VEVIVRSNLPDKNLCGYLRFVEPSTIDPALLDSLLAASPAFTPALGDLL
jgi:hypothetical protein